MNLELLSQPELEDLAFEAFRTFNFIGTRIESVQNKIDELQRCFDKNYIEKRIVDESNEIERLCVLQRSQSTHASQIISKAISEASSMHKKQFQDFLDYLQKYNDDNR